MILSSKILKTLNRSCLFFHAKVFKISHLKHLSSKTSDMFEFDKEIVKSEANSKLDFPYDINGFQIDLPTKAKYLAEQIMIRNKIPEYIFLEHLTKIFHGTLYSMGAKDTEFLTEYVEKNLLSKIVASLEEFSNKGYKIIVQDDINGDHGEPIPIQCILKDMVVTRGLSRNREENDAEDRYHKFIDAEDVGVVVYTPLDVMDPTKFIDPAKNKTIYEGYKKAVLRVLAEITSNIRLKFFLPSGEEILGEKEYNWKHLIVFESQLKPVAPLKSSYRLENYMEWLSKYNFGNWIISDIDNYMKGNPLIRVKNEAELYNDEIFKGTKFDPSARIDLRKV